MMYFAPTDIGPNRKLTWDGFLLCLNVPIARTGRMVYTTGDLPGYTAGKDGKLQVDRSEEDLFLPETIASFNGKAVTNDHPSAEPLLSPRSYRTAAGGTMLNPRRGEDDMSDCLVCDLLIQDAAMIEAVQNGKVQVSAGYDASYEQVKDGQLRQHSIKGNHLALVKSGRCGPRCAIGDSAPEEQPLCQCGATSKCQCGTNHGVDKMTKRAQLMNSARTALDALSTLDCTTDDDMSGAPPATTSEGKDGTHIHIHLPGDKDMSTPTPMGDATKDAKMTDSAKMRDKMTAMRDKRTRDKRTTDAIPGATPSEQSAPDPDGDDSDPMDMIMQVLDSVMARLETIETAMTPAAPAAPVAPVAPVAPAAPAKPAIPPPARDKRTMDDVVGMEPGKPPVAADEGIGKAGETADAEMSEEEAEKKAGEEQATKDKRTKDGVEGMDPGENPPAAEQTNDVRATRDAAGKIKDRDSTHLQGLVAETLSRGHILAQGMSLPTTDANATATMTLGRLCHYRRSALRAAFNDIKTQPFVKVLVPNVATLDACTCDTVTAMFTGASELVAKANNKTIGAIHNARLTHGTTTRSRTPAEINAANKARWGN